MTSTKKSRKQTRNEAIRESRYVNETPVSLDAAIKFEEQLCQWTYDLERFSFISLRDDEDKEAFFEEAKEFFGGDAIAAAAFTELVVSCEADQPAALSNHIRTI